MSNTSFSKSQHFRSIPRQIMSEYNDCLSRARRLSVAHEAHLMGKPPAHNSIKEDDMMIYTRWLTCYVHSVKKIHGYLRVSLGLHPQMKATIRIKQQGSYYFAIQFTLQSYSCLVHYYLLMS